MPDSAGSKINDPASDSWLLKSFVMFWNLDYGFVRIPVIKKQHSMITGNRLA